MKKTYSIYKYDVKEEWDTELLIEFDNEKDAEEFCNLKNLPYRHAQYFYRENVKYNSLSEYVKHNQNEYIFMLKNAINDIEFKLCCIEIDKKDFDVKLNRANSISHHAPLYVIKSIVENGPQSLNRTIYQDDREIKLTSKDYPTYVEKYNQILKQIESDKKQLAKYKKQLRLLTSKNKIEEESNENTL